MLNKLYFTLSISINLHGYYHHIRYIACPVMYVTEPVLLNDVKINLLRKIASYCINQFRVDDLSGLHEYSTRIDENGIVYIYSTNSLGNPVLMIYFSISFASYLRPGKQPLSKTAVIISRSIIQPAGVLSVTKV